MSFYFFKYFLGHIFKARSRQRLLTIAIVGLLLSSFSLLVLQAIMGGLQKGVIGKSKAVQGEYIIEVRSHEAAEASMALLQEDDVLFSREYEIELLAKNDQYMSGLILHGIDYDFYTPSFLQHKRNEGIVLGADLSSRLNAYSRTSIDLISPSHVDALLGDIPRGQRVSVSDFYMSDLTEIDSAHAWVRLSFVQNLIRKKSINKIRIYQEIDERKFKIGLNVFIKNDEISFYRWQDVNQSLFYALNLEKNMMLFLFAGMSLLVAITITSGFMLFFDKIKVDLMSLWVLGKSHLELMRLSFWLTQVISLCTCLLGLGLGGLFLFLLDRYSLNIMPDFFVERKIPILVNIKIIIVSFLIPYTIASFFSYLSFRFFKKDQTSFVYLLRKVG